MGIDLTIDGKDLKHGGEYYIVPDNASNGTIETIPEAYTGANKGRLVLPAGFKGWVGAKLSEWGIDVFGGSKLRFHLGYSGSNDVAGKSTYIDSFWLTKSASAPNGKPAIKPVQGTWDKGGQLWWQPETLPSELYTGSNPPLILGGGTPGAHNQYKDYIMGSVVNKGIGGSAALQYQLLKKGPDPWDYDLAIHWQNSTFSNDANGYDMIWYWVDTTEFKDGVNLAIELHFAQAKNAVFYTWDGKNDPVPGTTNEWSNNITALGTTMQNLTQSQLDIDYVVVKTPEAQWPKDDAGAFAYVWHEISSFFTSFSADYDSVGNTYDEGMEVIDVWILTGRDQANVLKTIIDDSFTPKTGIGVNLKLVEGGTVLSAVAAGTGPDIILSAGQGEPVNYALRNAAEDLTQFENWEEVYGRFHESAYRPFEFDGGIYAIPETQSFNVLFYRRDIFEELGIDVPQTWKDVQDILTVLQHANMEVGMPDIMRTNGADTSGFYAMMFQNGVELYSEDGKYALLDSEGAIKAFEVYTEFYTNSDIPKNYSFVDRFRSGEMPIGIADFSLQNTLAVFAPELKGLWDFTLIPGTQQADGSIDHSVLSNSACSMMLKSDDQQAKENGWEFLSWWTSAEVQARFGREMECLMGSAARYATANLEAFQQLSWSSEQLDVLNEARQWAQANREVAGGYYTGRHVVNAVRKVINDQTVPRETLLDYNKTINDEIKKKRAEFGLD